MLRASNTIANLAAARCVLHGQHRAPIAMAAGPCRITTISVDNAGPAGRRGHEVADCTDGTAAI